MKAERQGRVFLVGAGPGDVGLVTLRGAELLASADVVVHDGLISPAVLALATPRARRIYAGKKRAPDGEPLTQDEINRLIVEEARAGARVVRLKGGDPFVFGRGAEEVRALEAADIAYEVVPGVTSATAVPAYAGIPLTARGVTSTVALVTGHEDPDKAASDIDWASVARAGTIVLFMALARLEEVSRSLVLAGLPADTPAAAIHWGTTGAQRTLVSTLVELPERCRDSQLRPPALIVIGKVVSERSERPWFESRPLFGRRVLHTRDGEAGDRLTRLIGELGGEAVPLPVTEHLACATRDIDEAVASLRGQAFDWVVFASARAVEAFVDAVWRGGGDARSFHGTRLAAIGQRTARALEVRGLRADRIPGHGDGAALGQALADQGAGARALVPRASGGRPELVESLSRAFDEVVTVDVYETRDVDPGAAHMIDGLERIRRGDIDAALLFAPSQVRALTRALGDDAAAVLSAIPVIATIGATTAEELSSLGVRARIIASRPDASTLLAELAAHFDSDEEA